jgi:hypothetical protein
VLYGPIVRISPNELHVKDPGWFAELYPAGNNRRRDKYAWFLSEGTDATSSATVHHHLHRQRRATYAPSFSKQAIVGHERTVVTRAIEAMCENLDQHALQRKPVVLGTAFASITVDVVLQIWYAAPAGQPQLWSWFPKWTTPLPTLLGASHALRHFPQLFILMSLPSSWFKDIPDVSFILNLQEVCHCVELEPKPSSLTTSQRPQTASRHPLYRQRNQTFCIESIAVLCRTEKDLPSDWLPRVLALLWLPQRAQLRLYHQFCTIWQTTLQFCMSCGPSWAA